ncbi:hypothetical protein [Nocardia aurea]|uniref:Uncharacterized protein n=1 Tax=Nocardia aurea TaxID=2144174 RepID=A0ABV3FYA4_9NOCA
MDQQRASFGNPPTDQQREPGLLADARIDSGIDAATSTIAWSGSGGAGVYDPHAPVASAARVLVEQVDRRRRSAICTAPVLDAATELLATWCGTVAGLDPGTPDDSLCGEWAQRLAVIALEIVGTRQARLRPRTPEKAAALLGRVVECLAVRGVVTTTGGQCVVVPRADSAPRWGAYAPPCLAITIDIERGWGLIIDQPSLSPVIDLVGRCDDTGIEAMLDLVLAIDTGAHGNIFGLR